MIDALDEVALLVKEARRPGAGAKLVHAVIQRRAVEIDDLPKDFGAEASK